MLAEPVHSERIVQEGVVVEWMVDRLGGEKVGGPLIEGDPVSIRFKITDEATGEPIRGANPAGWIDLLPEGEKPDPEMRFAKASAFIEANLFSQAEVDLNVYHVITLNDDGTITVVDPLFGFGTTKMLALPQLASPGEDWAITRDRNRLFVSLPDTMQLAVVNTNSWEVDATIHTGLLPGRIALQPDEQYLWVANRGSGTESNDAGVTAVVSSTLQSRIHIPTGANPIDIAFTENSRYAFVANGVEGTVSIIDIPSLKVVHQVRIGKSASAVAYSELAGLAYALDEKGGRIVGISPEDGRVSVELEGKPGLSDLQFAPGGRFGLIPNPEENVVMVLDTATRRIAYTVELEGRPSRVAFSDLLAYITHEDSTDVSFMQIAHLDQGKSPSFNVFPAGKNPVGMSTGEVLASAISPAPGGDSVLVANPEDRVVYYYKEGMAAPMGSFNNYSRKPRAVLVVDRSLQERSEPGVYETSARLRSSGIYETIFFLDAPRMVHSFSFDVEKNPSLASQQNERKVDVKVALDRKEFQAKKPFTMQVRIFDPATKKPIDGVTDLKIAVFLSPGVWDTRIEMQPNGKPGGYIASVNLPEEGYYFFYLQSPSLGMDLSGDCQLTLKVGPAARQEESKKAVP